MRVLTCSRLRFSCFLLAVSWYCHGVLAQQPNFNKSCFGMLLKHDVDQNGGLNPNEYTAFVIEFTRGIARQPLPPDLVKVFMSLADPQAQQIPIQGAMEGADAQMAAITAKLCNNVNYVIRGLLQVAVPPDQCMSTLVASDTTPPRGEISKEPEYIAMLSGLTGTPYTQTSFDQLSVLTKSAYEDMTINGVIAGSAGTQYLTEFCARAVTAAKLDSIADKMNPPAPSVEAEADNETAAPVDGNSTTVETPTPTETNATAAPSEDAEEVVELEDVEMPDLFYERCKGSMLFIDRNRDNELNLKEFGPLIDRLADEVNNTIRYKEAQDFYDERFEEVMRGESDSDPSIRGSKPAQIPSDEDIVSLKFVCRTTFQAMVDSTTDNGGGVDKGMMKQTGKKQAAPLNVAFFSDCRRSMYIADSDRNIGLDVDEFLEMVERLAPDAEYVENFGDLDGELQDVYKMHTRFLRDANEFMIDVSGSKPASRATDEEMERMEALCGAMQSVLMPPQDEDSSSD